MYRSTRFKLTAWYLFIIMVVSFVFSSAIYFNVDSELARFEESQKVVLEQQLVNEAKSRLIVNLAYLNLAILICAGAAGYFLAGRTLRPIKRMIDDQTMFIGDASHELKTPLTALRSEIEIYLRSKKHTIKESDEILKSNLEEVERLQRLAEGLMELTSYGKMNGRLTFQETSLKEVLKSALKNITSLSKEKNITIVNRAREIALLADSQTLTGLFTILLDNAIKYSPRNTKITLTSDVQERMGVIHVRDQGIGIPQKEVDKVFNRFYRVDKSRSTSAASGYGLGLSIAKEIVTLHKGTISVKSSKRGSIFSVEIPLS